MRLPSTSVPLRLSRSRSVHWPCNWKTSAWLRLQRSSLTTIALVGARPTVIDSPSTKRKTSVHFEPSRITRYAVIESREKSQGQGADPATRYPGRESDVSVSLLPAPCSRRLLLSRANLPKGLPTYTLFPRWGRIQVRSHRTALRTTSYGNTAGSREPTRRPGTPAGNAEVSAEGDSFGPRTLLPSSCSKIVETKRFSDYCEYRQW